MESIMHCSSKLLALMLATATLHIAAGAQKANPMQQQNVQRGEALFHQSCASCHGVTASGGIGPSLIESSLVRHDVNGGLIAPVVQNGRPDNGMPAFPSLTSAQISDIAAFVHARIIVTNSVETAGPIGGYSLQRLLTGNAEAGKQYFNGTGGCSHCHSPTGDLAGIASKYSPAALESRFLYPTGVDITATVTPPSGKTIEGKLVHLDAFYVAIVDSTGLYNSWPVTQVIVQTHDPLEAHEQLLGKYSNKDVHDVFAYLETLK
jgi:cytochrome c oxidase cbb3-type subunit III